MEEVQDVAARLDGAGFAVHVEAFATRSSADPWLAAYAGLAAVAALLVYPLPFVACVVGTAAVVLHARESDGRPLLARRSTSDANVVARGPHAPPPELVILTSRRPRQRRPRLLALSLQTLMAAVPAAGAVAWIAEVETDPPKGVLTAGTAAAVALVALALVLYRPPPGSGDARSDAVELLAELAPRLLDRRVWLVVLGAGGIHALLDAHVADVSGAAWLNLEPAPGNRVVAVSEEGAWRERRGDRRLLGCAEEAGAGVASYRATTDATPLLARRRRALTLLVPGGRDGEDLVLATVAAATGDRSVPGRR